MGLCAGLRSEGRSCCAWQEEFVGAQRALKAMRADGGRVNWQRLFEPYDFFNGFKNYLQVGHTPALPELSCLAVGWHPLHAC